MDLKGTQTEKNIAAAFAGESQARNKYSYYAEKAKEEGLETTRALFEKMADNERQHAKVWFKLMTGQYGKSTENLMQAIAGEHYEWTEMYKGFAQTARDEGLENVAILFERVASVECDHERRFLQELSAQSDAHATAQVQEPATGSIWHCTICGYTHKGDEPPYACPLCGALGTWETA